MKNVGIYMRYCLGKALTLRSPRHGKPENFFLSEFIRKTEAYGQQSSAAQKEEVLEVLNQLCYTLLLDTETISDHYLIDFALDFIFESALCHCPEQSLRFRQDQDYKHIAARLKLLPEAMVSERRCQGLCLLYLCSEHLHTGGGLRCLETLKASLSIAAALAHAVSSSERVMASFSAHYFEQMATLIHACQKEQHNLNNYMTLLSMDCNTIDLALKQIADEGQYRIDMSCYSVLEKEDPKDKIHSIAVSKCGEHYAYFDPNNGILCHLREEELKGLMTMNLHALEYIPGVDVMGIRAIYRFDENGSTNIRDALAASLKSDTDLLSHLKMIQAQLHEEARLLLFRKAAA